MKGLRGIARAVSALGIAEIVLHYRRVRRREGRALILMYHRIADDEDYLGMCVPPAVFDRQLELLRRRAEVLPLREVVRRLASDHVLAHDVAAITFDDGYRDNLDKALPLLERHALPATVFVTTGFIDGSVRPAGDRLREAVEAIWKRGIAPSSWPPLANGWDTLVGETLARPGSTEALRRLRVGIKRASPDVEARILTQLETLAGDLVESASSLMLDWDGVRTLAKRGVEIGSHTLSHPILSQVPLAAAEHELRASRERLEAEIGEQVIGFAFPNGQ